MSWGIDDLFFVKSNSLQQEAPFSQLASELKQKIFVGKGFATNDTFAPEINIPSLWEGVRPYVHCMVQILMGS